MSHRGPTKLQRDNEGWRIPKSGTKSARIYALTKEGKGPTEIAAVVGGSRTTISVLLWKIRNPAAANQAIYLSARGKEQNRSKTMSAKEPSFAILIKNNSEMDYDPMDIYSKSGTRVRYTGFGGYDHDKKHADKYLIVDAVYSVSRTDVDAWRTDVYLKEVPGQCFNSVHFAKVS